VSKSIKQTRHVTAAVARTHFYRRPPVGPTEGNSLTEKGQQAGRTLVFSWKSWDYKTTHVPGSFQHTRYYWHHKVQLWLWQKCCCFQIR